MGNEASFSPAFMNRALQHEVLLELAESYVAARFVDVQGWKDSPDKIAALRYLEGHGLVNVDWSRDMSNTSPKPLRAQATVHGLDFLADDGGLSAVLDVVTIRLHADTVRELLLTKIENAHDISPEERSSLTKAIHSLPGRALEKLTDKLLDLGADRLALEISTLRMWLGQP